MNFRHNHSPRRGRLARRGVLTSSERQRRIQPAVEGLEDRRLLAITPSTLITDPTPVGTSSHITTINVGNEGSFQVHHTGFTNGQFYSPSSAPADAGLFIRHTDGTVDGIDTAGRSPSAATSTNSKPFRPISQTTSPDGLTVTTIFDNGATPNGPGDKEQVTQVVTYQPNKEFFTTTNTIKNIGTAAETLDFFVAGDIYLADSDRGVGLYSAASGAIGGTDVTGTYNIFFQPRRATGILDPTKYEASRFGTIWSIIGGNTDFDNTVNLPTTPAPYTNDPNYYDNGAGLEWKAVVIAPGASVTISNYTGFGAITSVVPDANLRITATPVVTVEGSLSGGVVATFTHPNATTPASGYTATIDWGDGSLPSTGVVAAIPVDPANPNAPQQFSVTATHIYPEENSTPLAITVTVVDNVASVSNQATTTATVVDAPLTTTLSTFFPTEGRLFTGQVATFTDADIFGTVSDYTATITWGDGQVSAGRIAVAAGNQPGMAPTFNVFGTNLYAEEGIYPVSVTVTDSGGAAPATNPLTNNTVVVPDSALVPVNVNVLVSGVEGVAFTGPVGSFLDIDLGSAVSDYTATITYNGKTYSGIVKADPTAANRYIVTPSTPLVFEEEGAQAISVIVQDAGGAVTPFTVTANVSDAPLSQIGVVAISGTRGSTFEGVVGSFRDADPRGIASDYTATIAWGDGLVTTGSVQDTGFGFFNVLGSHSFATEGNLPVSILVSDAGGASATLQGSATVPDAPLALTGVPFTITQNSAFSGTVASLLDGDSNATAADYTVLIAWGDGSVTNGVVQASTTGPGRFNISGGHTYAFPGNYTVAVTVRDVGSATAATSFAATVNASPLYALTGSLAASSDSGVSQSDGITNVNLPTFVGTAGPNVHVQIVGQRFGSPTGSLFGQGDTDATGRWTITVFSALPDGAYSLVASATDGNGNLSSVPTRLQGGAPVYIVTAAPVVTNALYNSRTNQVLLNIQTTGTPLNLAALTNPANYTFTRTDATRTSPLPIQAIGLTGNGANVGVVIRLNVGRGHPKGVLMSVNSAALSDLAGNLLDGSFQGTFPSGASQPGSGFRGQFFTDGNGIAQAVTAYPPVNVQGAAQHEVFLGKHTASRSRRGRVSR